MDCEEEHVADSGKSEQGATTILNLEPLKSDKLVPPVSRTTNFQVDEQSTHTNVELGKRIFVD